MIWFLVGSLTFLGVLAFSGIWGKLDELQQVQDNFMIRAAARRDQERDII